MNKRIRQLLPVLIPGAAAGILFLFSQGRTQEVSVTQETTALQTQIQTVAEPEPQTDSAAAPSIWVYVCGAVRDPGVYRLDEDARVFEAVERAGGFREDAAQEMLNLAGKLSDGQQIYVPDLERAETMDAPLSASDGKININTASLEELKTLPGIGDTKAADIIAYRSKQAFESIEDIMQVSGIKESSFERIRDLITCSG